MKSSLGRLWGSDRPLVFLLLVFALLASFYSVTTPVFEAPDVIQHFHYIEHLKAQQRLPVQGPDGAGTWEQEGSQPPLYYLLGAILTAPVDTRDLDAVLWLNPQANIGNPLQPGNKNRLIHRPQEQFPYRGSVLAIHLVRWLSVLLATGAIFCTFQLAREIISNQTGLALVAAGLTAFNPQFCFIAGAVSNDNLVTFLAALSLWLTARYLLGRTTPREMWVWAAAVALASLAKVSGLALLPLAGCAMLARAIHERSPQRFWRDGLQMVGVWLVVAGWWYARNWLLYGEPTGTHTMAAIAGERPFPLTRANLRRELQGLRLSYFGVFGWFNILGWPWLSRVFDVAGSLTAVGLAFTALRSWRKLWQPRGLALLILSVWGFLLLASLLRWTSITPGSQGRLLFPASPALAILFVMGWKHLPLLGRTRWPLTLLLGGMALLALLTPVIYIRPAYQPPRTLTEAEIPDAARRPPLYHANAIRLLGCEVQPQVAHPGQTVEVTFYWQALRPMEYDYNLFIRILGFREQVIAQVDTYPGAGTWPTSLWQPGQVIEDRYTLTVSPSARTPVLAQVDFGFYDLETMVGLPSLDESGAPASSLVAPVRVVSRQGQAEPDGPALYTMGGEIALVSYEVQPTTLHPGETILVTLTWRAIAPVSRDYTAFLHLVSDGKVIAQQDRPPISGYYPTSAWAPGEGVTDRIRVLVGRGVVPGTYPLYFGFYLLEDQSRLHVADLDGRGVGSQILLGEITVEGQ
ncbi:MAG: hypothetical protein GX605_08465 [Chloroflexi bacterium]|nr:hypothetical protein [Chloroflexota bacterium]